MKFKVMVFDHEDKCMYSNEVVGKKVVSDNELYYRIHKTKDNPDIALIHHSDDGTLDGHWSLAVLYKESPLSKKMHMFDRVVVLPVS